MRVLLLACLLVAGAAKAGPVPGVDDPAFTQPFHRALQGDDPSALSDLRAAAEAGNTAALIALPTVLVWLPPTGTLAERNGQRRVNGRPVAEAAAKASVVVRNWQGGDMSEIASLPDRALRLFEAGENTKASALFAEWVAYTAGRGTAPKALFTAPATLQVGAFALATRLSADPQPALVQHLSQLVAKDLPAGWLALAMMLSEDQSTALLQPQGGGSEVVVQVPRTALTEKKRQHLYSQIVGKTVAKDHADLRLRQAQSFLANRGFRDTVGAVPLPDAQGIVEFLAGTSEFEPIAALCQAQCPGSRSSCELAAVQTVGSGLSLNERQVPPHEIMTTADFIASPRGRNLVVQALLQPIAFKIGAQKTLPAIVQTDACLANLLQQALPDSLR